MRQYHSLLHHILDSGVAKTDRTLTGTLSVFGPQMRFNLAEGFPLLTTKKLHLKSIIHELLWILRGDTNIKYLVDNGVNIWNDWPLKEYNDVHQKNPMTMDEFVDAVKNKEYFGERWGDLGPVYGKQWTAWRNYPQVGNELARMGQLYKPVNQLQQMVDLLKATPDSRRMVVSAWNVADLPQMALSPCHCLFQFYTVPLTLEQREEWFGAHTSFASWQAYASYVHREQREAALKNCKVPEFRLDCQLYQRSADVFLGVPFNVASYALLTLMVAQVVNMVPGEFIWTGGDTHLYNNHFEQAKLQLEREPRDLPRMVLNPAVTDLFGFKFEDFTLAGYNAWPGIKAPVAV